MKFRAPVNQEKAEALVAVKRRLVKMLLTAAM